MGFYMCVHVLLVISLQAIRALCDHIPALPSRCSSLFVHPICLIKTTRFRLNPSAPNANTADTSASSIDGRKKKQPLSNSNHEKRRKKKQPLIAIRPWKKGSNPLSDSGDCDHGEKKKKKQPFSNRKKKKGKQKQMQACALHAKTVVEVPGSGWRERYSSLSFFLSTLNGKVSIASQISSLLKLCAVALPRERMAWQSVTKSTIAVFFSVQQAGRLLSSARFILSFAPSTP